MFFRIIKPIDFNSFVWAIIFAMIGWLFWAASIVGIETGDGYVTITASQYLLGMNDLYGGQRGPLMAFYLMPAEWLSNQFNLHPLDVRLHHVQTALIHSVYLIFVWQLLKNYYQDSGFSVALAYLATIPSYIFFSYAIYINTDIFPGLILLLMILKVDEFDQKPTRVLWISLVLLGCLAVLIKQTFALYWVVILFVSIFVYSRKTSLYLFYAASVSAFITYIIYSVFLYGVFPDIYWLFRPIKLYFSILTQYDGSENVNDIFVWWLYIRNFYNYGLLASIVILPSLVYVLFFYKSVDHNVKILKILAITWGLLFILMHIIVFKEVRYIAYLSPLSAFILVPIIRYFLASKYVYPFIMVAVICLTFDVTRNSIEALRINAEYYQSMVQKYFKDLPAHKVKIEKDIDQRVAIINQIVFTPAIFSPLKYDRYHRTNHFDQYLLAALYDYPLGEFFQTSNEDYVGYEMFQENDLLFFSNEILLRSPPWNPLNTVFKGKKYLQLVGVAEKITLTKHGDNFSFDKKYSTPLLLISSFEKEFKVIVLLDTPNEVNLSEILTNDVIKMQQIALMGFKVTRLCNQQGCYDMENNKKFMY